MSQSQGKNSRCSKKKVVVPWYVEEFKKRKESGEALILQKQGEALMVLHEKNLREHFAVDFLQNFLGVDAVLNSYGLITNCVKNCKVMGRRITQDMPVLVCHQMISSKLIRDHLAAFSQTHQMSIEVMCGEQNAEMFFWTGGKPRIKIGELEITLEKGEKLVRAKILDEIYYIPLGSSKEKIRELAKAIVA